MKYLIDEVYKLNEEDKKNATSKAREDIKYILELNNFQIISKKITKKKNGSIIDKIISNVKSLLEWKRFISLQNFSRNDIVCIQYPMVNYPLGFSYVLRSMRKKNVKVLAIIHDLNCIRYPDFKSYQKKEIKTLNSFDYLVAHNLKMNKKLRALGVKNPKIVELELFDYIVKYSDMQENKTDVDIVIAGNLSKSKSGYLYSLPQNVLFGLYGLNYEGNSDNVLYYGAFSPDELPNMLNGKFGLVWDGPSNMTCEGNYGEYLRINNPHKASLYLASGIPIITWNQSAIADFVKKHECGITIASLFDIPLCLAAISPLQYQKMFANSKKISQKVRSGEFTKKALNNIWNSENK